MSVVVVGIERNQASKELLEKLAWTGDRLTNALELMSKSDHIAETVALSTCMRTEVYVDAVRFHPAISDIADVFCTIGDVDRDEIADHLFVLHDEDAYRHLFSVASGLESAVIGEGEVLGQVIRSWELAQEKGSARSVMSTLFRHAVVVGKRVRTETAISRGTTSIGQAAVEMAASHLGGLNGKSVLIIGAGEMSRSMAHSMSHEESLARLSITNRTEHRARALADEVGAIAQPFVDLPKLLQEADVVLSSTGSLDPIIDVADVIERPKPLVVVDLAVPSDVSQGVADVDGVTVLNLNDLQLFAESGQAQRRNEAVLAQSIVDEEVGVFCANATERMVAPVVAALRERAESIRTEEMRRNSQKLSALEPEELEAVRALTHSILQKLLHQPTVRLKRYAGTPEGERMAEALRSLFEV